MKYGFLILFVVFFFGCNNPNNTTVQKSSNALLSAIIVDNGILAPSFSSSVFNYTLFFSYLSNVNSVTIIGIKDDGNATVSAPITINNLTPGTVENISITVTAENGLTNKYNIRVERGLGNEVNFSYELSLITERITIRNNNLNDPIFIWASTNDIVHSRLGIVKDARRLVLPGETIEIDAAISSTLSWLPDIIYTLPNGRTYKYLHRNFGTASSNSFEILLLDFDDIYYGDIPEFREVFIINTSEAHEAHYGNTSNFSWVDRRNGLFRISPSTNRESIEGFVGNIEGTKANGDRVWLPHISFFVTEKYPIWNSMWDNDKN